MSGCERPGIKSLLNLRTFKTTTPASLQGALKLVHVLLWTRVGRVDEVAISSARIGTLWRKEQKVDMVRSRTQRRRMCKRGVSPSSCGSYLSRGPSEVKCSNKSEDETSGHLYTDANQAENSFFIGSEWIVGMKIQALPLLLKTAGTDNSRNG